MKAKEARGMKSNVGYFDWNEGKWVMEILPEWKLQLKPKPKDED
jgi:hypothetical protein